MSWGRSWQARRLGRRPAQRLALLIALNVIDIALTRRFLTLGLEEGNPLMAVTVRSWTAAACK